MTNGTSHDQWYEDSSSWPPMAWFWPCARALAVAVWSSTTGFLRRRDGEKHFSLLGVVCCFPCFPLCILSIFFWARNTSTNPETWTEATMRSRRLTNGCWMRPQMQNRKADENPALDARHFPNWKFSLPYASRSGEQQVPCSTCSCWCYSFCCFKLSCDQNAWLTTVRILRYFREPLFRSLQLLMAKSTRQITKLGIF